MPFYTSKSGTKYFYKAKDEIGRGEAYFKAKNENETITPQRFKITDWAECFIDGRVNRGKINLVFKRLSLCYHPDKGGSHEMYVRIIKTRDDLIKLSEGVNK